MKFLSLLLGDSTKKYLRSLQPIVDQVNALEKDYEALSDDALRGKTDELRARLSSGDTLDSLIPDAFTAVREASKRTLNQRHFDMQILGALALHKGSIAEMKTGEGKTLTATLTAYLNALEGKGVHIITVNDYLARRDCAWMGQIYNLLGMSVGCIQHERAFLYDSTVVKDEEDNSEETVKAYRVDQDHLREVKRKDAYQADITYGTNNEYGFDYLRDNMVYAVNDMVQRGQQYAIVDEVDSILIDEARTPLIISAAVEDSTERYYRYADVVRRLVPEQHYLVDEKMRTATFTEEGIEAVEKILGYENIYATGIMEVHHLEQALQAMALFKLDRDYVNKDGEIVIVDEFTGRLMFGRRYSEGLHQAIEAKERVEIKKESRTLATVTLQNYFRLYTKLSGMTGTAETEAEEFFKIYGLEVTVVPTTRPMVRKDYSDRVYKNEHEKMKAVVEEIKARHSHGQPLLVGTISIEKNEKLSALLEKAGIPHTLLNAKNHEKEAEIIAQAGRLKAVTVATNMAGRGVDIILGGNPVDPKEAEAVRNAGGLHVIGTERHESRRIDNQLRGRSGRQGDAGSSQFFVSFDDDLMRIFGSDRIKSVMSRLGVPDDMPIENSMVSRSLESAQQKVEGHNFDIRKHLVEYDDVTNKQREIIYQKRRELLHATLEPGTLKQKYLSLIGSEIDELVDAHRDSEESTSVSIYDMAATIFPIAKEERTEFDKDYDALKEHLKTLSRSKYPDDGDETVEKLVYLQILDNAWMEHLESLDYLRHGIGLQGYAQKDPLVEYKRASYQQFKALLREVERSAAYTIYKVKGTSQTVASPKPSMTAQAINMIAPTSLTESEKQRGRNDPCWCGSGKKFKKCHGK